MKFLLKDTNERKEITVKPWSGSGYGPDCFSDLEVNFPLDHECEEGGDALICTSSEYEELLNWWQDEVEAMNAHELGQNGDDYTENTGDELSVLEE